MCDYEKYIDTLNKEELNIDIGKLNECRFNKKNKEQFKDNINEIRKKFIETNKHLNDDEIILIYKVFEFIKNNL